MRLTTNATSEELRDAASLEVWTNDQILEKGKLTLAQRIIFLNETTQAAVALMTKLLDGHIEKPASAPKPLTRCVKTGLHKHYGKMYEGDRKHDTKGKPWPKRTKKPNAPSE